MLEQTINIRQDVLKIENLVVQSNGQNVNIKYDGTKIDRHRVDDSDKEIHKNIAL